MASALIFGKVKNSKENAFMLDSGDWISTPRGEDSPAAGANVLVSYWTKNSQYNGTWRTFRNAVHIRVLEGKFDFKELQAALVQFGQEVELTAYTAPAADIGPAPTSDFNDDIPF
jgi:hypothetical protein